VQGRSTNQDRRDYSLARKKGRSAAQVVTVSNLQDVPAAAVKSVPERPEPVADEAVVGSADEPFLA
jgi:hypothetical protein